MNLAILSFLVVLAVLLIVLIVKENMEYRKALNEANGRYDSRLKNELEAAEE